MRAGFPEPAAMDTAVSHALLRRASEGLEAETLRLHRPSSIVAFGPRDHLAPGFGQAVQAARAQGFSAVRRLAGGRAAVFHEGTIAFSWIRPDPTPGRRIEQRFAEVADIMSEAFRSLGVDARVGEVPGEYCPGAHSVNARGKTKVMGVGQRLVQHAAHVGGVVVVDGSARVREVLLPVYEALALTWDPATSGSLRDEVPGLGWDEALGAILRAFGDRYRVVEADLSPVTVDLAGTLRAGHEVPADPAGGVKAAR